MPKGKAANLKEPPVAKIRTIWEAKQVITVPGHITQRIKSTAWVHNPINKLMNKQINGRRKVSLPYRMSGGKCRGKEGKRKQLETQQEMLWIWSNDEYWN